MFIPKSFAVALILASSAYANNTPPKNGADFKIAIHQSLFTSLSGIVREIFVHEISKMELADITSTIPPLFTLPHIPSSNIDYSLKNMKIERVSISPKSNVALKDKAAELRVEDVGFQVSAEYHVAVRTHPVLSDKGKFTMGVNGGAVHSLITMGSNGRGGIKVAMESTNVSLNSLVVDLKGSKASPIVNAFRPLIDLMVRPILTTAIGLIVEKVVPPVFNTILANQLSIGLGLPTGEVWDVHTEIVDSPTIDPTGISFDIALKTKYTA